MVSGATETSIDWLIDWLIHDICCRFLRRLLVPSNSRSHRRVSCSTTSTTNCRHISSVREKNWNSISHSTATTIPSTTSNPSAKTHTSGYRCEEWVLSYSSIIIGSKGAAVWCYLPVCSDAQVGTWTNVTAISEVDHADVDGSLIVDFWCKIR